MKDRRFAGPLRSTPGMVLMKALRAHAPEVLRDLLARPSTKEAVTQWAHDYAVASPTIVTYMVAQRAAWEEQPQMASYLGDYFGGTWTVPGDGAPGVEAARQAWLDAQIGGEHAGVTLWRLPDPSWETLEEWIDRARTIYDEMVQINGGVRPKPQDRRGRERVEHYNWFVHVQVLGKSVTAVAAHFRKDRAAVRRGAAEVAAALGVTPSPRSHGRSKRK